MSPIEKYQGNFKLHTLYRADDLEVVKHWRMLEEFGP